MRKVAMDSPAIYKFKMRMSPEIEVYKSEDNGKVILFDEGAKTMLEVNPDSLKMMK